MGERAVAAFYATDINSAAAVAWRQAHPDWFIAGTWRATGSGEGSAELRVSFGIEDVELESEVRNSLRQLASAGARPIQGRSADGGYWIRITRFGDDPDAIVAGVIREWQAAGVDPDIGGLWFASPKFIEAECRYDEDDAPPLARDQP